MELSRRALFWMKHLPQVSQLKGRSPVWIRWWPLRVSAWLKLLPHVSHLNGFSPYWQLPETAARRLSHTRHRCGVSHLDRTKRTSQVE
uniref:Uncharacterized protein n=1 Tax=Stegastes partitus TaxID=144197 RepID=A0A3B5AGV9_9TELE